MSNGEDSRHVARLVIAVEGDVARLPPGDDEFAEGSSHEPSHEGMKFENVDRAGNQGARLLGLLGVLVDQELCEAIEVGQRVLRVDDQRHFRAFGAFAGRPFNRSANHVFTSSCR